MGSIVRTVPGVGIYFSAMHAMKTNFCNGKPSSLASVVIGASARCIAGSIMIPATVIKVRCESGMFQNRGIGEAFQKIYGKEGLKGLTSGILPTLFRDAPFSGLYLMLYQNLKTGSAGMAPITGDSTLHFLCGISAGCLASMITHPADVIKTQMQLSADDHMDIICENLPTLRNGRVHVWSGTKDAQEVTHGIPGLDCV